MDAGRESAQRTGRESTGQDESAQRPKGGGTLGTFGGVFTPSVLTILGIILFMRLGYVVGAAGLGQMLLILVLANLISVLTSLSLSAVATNLRVKRGGDYYLISRTLGQEFGGAIGMVLFLAQAVSIGFYCIGFAEVVVGLLPADMAVSVKPVAAVAALALFILAWLGADWATRFQYGVMTLLVLALLSFFIGGVQHFDFGQLQENWQPGLPETSFWVLFALFFPAVTGFTQGVSMSGDLKDPGRSLPLGTLLAVGLSILIYLAAAVLFAAALPSQTLIGDYEAMQQIAWIPLLIVAGVLSATLSSAMASFLGAPRILQSLAEDRLLSFLRPFAKGVGPQNNPRRAVLLSGAVALLTIGIGELDLIAPVVSMFFLISYGLINYATFFEASAASPSFRPRFRFFHPKASLAGALACFGAMLAIDLVSSLLALVVLLTIYFYLRRTVPQARWADGRRSYHLHRVRAHLLEVADEPEHPRDWRPNILLFSDSSHRRLPLLKLADSLGGDSGFVTAVKILYGRDLRALKEREIAAEELRNDIRRSQVDAFPLVLTVSALDSGVHTLVQSFGLGPLRANMIMLNWLEHRVGAEDTRAEERFGRHLRTAYRLGVSLLVLDGEEAEWQALEAIPPRERRIDLWWWGGSTGHLSLLLAHLMTRSAEWEGARIRVLALAPKSSETDIHSELQALLAEVRINAEACVVEGGDEELPAQSKDAALVMMPMRLHHNLPLDPFGNPLNEVFDRLPPTLMILAAQDIELDAEPEEGELAEQVRLRDAVIDTARVTELMEKDHLEAQAKYETLLAQEGADSTEIERLKAQLEHTHRRLLKARFRAEEAVREAQAQGLLDSEEDSSEQNSDSTARDAE